jgi:Predicted metal-dependent hydrolase of the TIM-barrel fold
MQSLHFFDCNASFGMRSVRLPGSFYKKEELLAQMDAYSIERALVYHAMAREYDPQTGNEILMDSIKGEKRLVPVWTVLPHYTGEFDPPQTLIRRMRGQNVRAVTMFPSPSCQNYGLSEYSCGALFSALAEHRIPLLIGLDQLGSMQALGDLCRAYPGLPIVVTNVTYRIDRDLYPLLERFDNFSVETSGYKVMDGIAQICARFGAKRLIFGTGMPVTSGSASVGLLSYADISQEDKQKIASDNLMELLGGVRYE